MNDLKLYASNDVNLEGLLCAVKRGSVLMSILVK